MPKMPDSVTVQVKIVDPDMVKGLVEDLGWPFEICFDSVPERYIEPVAAYYQQKEGYTETLQMWVDAIRAELEKSIERPHESK